MPIFNGSANNLATQVASGDTIPLFSTSDTVANGSISKVIAPVDAGPVARKGIMFAANGFGVTIYGSNTYPTSAGPQNGQVLATPAAGSGYQDTTSFAFYWAVASGAGPGSVIAHVN